MKCLQAIREAVGMESGNSDDRLTFLHISPKKNRASILKNGLKMGLTPSGYGDTPDFKAVYLYHEDNINVIYDLIKMFKDFDVFEVNLDKSDEVNLIADEDAISDNKRVKTWKDSVNQFGTLAIESDIPASKVTFMMNCNNR